MWELHSGILHSSTGCSLPSILRLCHSLKTSGHVHPVTQHNIPEERVFLTALLCKPKNLHNQYDLWFWVMGEKYMKNQWYHVVITTNINVHRTVRLERNAENYCPHQITWSLLAGVWRGKLVRGEAQQTQLQPFSFISETLSHNL
jgi:hypothetical protein